MKKAETIGSKAKHPKSTITTIAIVSSLAKKIRDFLITGSNRTYSDGRDKKDKCSNGMSKPADRVCASQSIYHRSR